MCTEDLVWALEEHEIGGAGLDVVEQEPLPADHPLWYYPNVYITPHCTPQVPHRAGRSIEIIRENARRFEADEPMHFWEGDFMKVVAAIDSFKGSLSSMRAGYAAREGILRAHPGAQVVVRPLADGGEGTADALIEGLGGERITVQAAGPLGEDVFAQYGLLKKNGMAGLHGGQTSFE